MDHLDSALAPSAFVTEDDPPNRRANSMWLGSDQTLQHLRFRRGAEVTIDQLAAALRNTRGAVDLTFSAPQSVSWVWALAGDEQRAGLERAMFVAADKTLGYLTQTVNFAASVTLHATARTADIPDQPARPPLLHTHCHMIGVLDGDRALQPLNTRPLNNPDRIRELGAVNRAVLADELVMLGYSIKGQAGPDRRYFEIEGVPTGMFHPRLWDYAQCGGLLGDDFLREWDGPCF
ncbi:MAG TPA: relaxase domain-containing protein [Actinophytocola sp.]|uniref:relaxase domain-containing protein n=1 Tax=Actinophytocola sp. TaxID=1872138 RepID=UPI002DDCC233|nr:relaxase domain-containing protein [Actinophytocola sp.]HEV2780373.1 relaxase domain-containing protein [Actinophytocola sp.]